LINDQVNPSRHGQKPMVCIIHFGDFSSLVNQQGNIVQIVFRDKIAVRFGGISVDAYYLDSSRFVFFNVLLKLNKLANSPLGIIFGIKGQHHAPIILEDIT
jgi:hypothetical protein